MSGHAYTSEAEQKGAVLNSEGTSTSANEGRLGFGCDPASGVARRAIDRCDPTLLATSKIAVMIDESVY